MKEIYALGVGHSTPLFIEIAEAAGWKVAGLYHYNDERTGEFDHGFEILGSFEDLFKRDLKGMDFLLTMGDMRIRKQVSDNLMAVGGSIPSILHPSARVSRFAKIAEQGVIIGDGVELQSDVIVGDNAIIRSDVTVCHNTTIKPNVFVGPKALVGAYITLGEYAYIGQGSILVSDKAESIGENSLIGAGALVTKPIPENVIAVGSPAKVIKSR